MYDLSRLDKHYRELSRSIESNHTVKGYKWVLSSRITLSRLSRSVEVYQHFQVHVKALSILVVSINDKTLDFYLNPYELNRIVKICQVLLGLSSALSRIIVGPIKIVSHRQVCLDLSKSDVAAGVRIEALSLPAVLFSHRVV